jgi:hypothetical protein
VIRSSASLASFPVANRDRSPARARVVSRTHGCRSACRHGGSCPSRRRAAHQRWCRQSIRTSRDGLVRSLGVIDYSGHSSWGDDVLLENTSAAGQGRRRPARRSG